MHIIIHFLNSGHLAYAAKLRSPKSDRINEGLLYMYTLSTVVLMNSLLKSICIQHSGVAKGEIPPFFWISNTHLRLLPEARVGGHGYSSPLVCLFVCL